MKSICFQKPHMSFQQFPAVYLECCVSHLLNILFRPFSYLLGYYIQPCCSLLLETTCHTSWNKKKPLDGNPFIFYHEIDQPRCFHTHFLILLVY